jgi:hypothetical protein
LGVAQHGDDVVRPVLKAAGAELAHLSAARIACWLGDLLRGSGPD